MQGHAAAGLSPRTCGSTMLILEECALYTSGIQDRGPLSSLLYSEDSSRVACRQLLSLFLRGTVALKPCLHIICLQMRAKEQEASHSTAVPKRSSSRSSAAKGLPPPTMDAWGSSAVRTPPPSSRKKAWRSSAPTLIQRKGYHAARLGHATFGSQCLLSRFMACRICFLIIADAGVRPLHTVQASDSRDSGRGNGWRGERSLEILPEEDARAGKHKDRPAESLEWERWSYHTCKLLPQLREALIPLDTFVLEEPGARVRSFPAQETYRKILSESILDIETSGTRKVLSFASEASPPKAAARTILEAPPRTEKSVPRRQIPKAAELILDAPDLPANFYLNLLDWSCRNVVAIGLKEEVRTDTVTIQARGGLGGPRLRMAMSCSCVARTQIHDAKLPAPCLVHACMVPSGVPLELHRWRGGDHFLQDSGHCHQPFLGLQWLVACNRLCKRRDGHLAYESTEESKYLPGALLLHLCWRPEGGLGSCARRPSCLFKQGRVHCGSDSAGQNNTRAHWESRQSGVGKQRSGQRRERLANQLSRW